MPRLLLITGSSGIAAATARLATASGETVFLIGNDRQQCESLSSELKGSAFSAADVADENALQHAVASCISRLGGIDAVFNVAGLSARCLGDGPLHECSTAAWRKMMDAHASGTFFVCREVIRHWMSTKRAGTILNTSSVLACFPERVRFATVAYAASKGAIISMSRAMAAYYAPHKIRVNVIAPGLVRTPMSERAQSDEEVLHFIARKQPLSEGMLDPADVARTALFLLGEQSRHMTGQVVGIDGGWAVS